MGFFNDSVPPNGSVYIHDTLPTSFDMLKRDGRLRTDINIAWGVGYADFSIVHHELHMNEVDFQIWQAFQSPDVDEVLTFDGVPIISVYRNPRLRNGDSQ